MNTRRLSGRREAKGWVSWCVLGRLNVTRDKRDSKNEGLLAAVLIFLPCLYIMVEGVWAESRANLLESALMSKGWKK